METERLEGRRFYVCMIYLPCRQPDLVYICMNLNSEVENELFELLVNIRAGLDVFKILTIFFLDHVKCSETICRNFKLKALMCVV
jgi:hypothetical protein